MFREKKTKRKLSICIIAVVLLLALGMIGAVLSMDQAVGENPMSGINENSSQVMVTGEQYSLNTDMESLQEEEDAPEEGPLEDEPEEPEAQENEKDEPEKDQAEEQESDAEEEPEEPEENPEAQDEEQKPVDEESDEKVESDDAEAVQEGEDGDQTITDEDGSEEPTDPVEPIEPEVPIVPDDPVEPDEPIEPVAPIDPIDPIEPEVPDEPEIDKTPTIITDLEGVDVVEGTRLTFNLEAKDYKNRRIESFNFSVYVNDVKIYSSGESTYKRTYRADLQDGDNQIVITVKDSYGNTASRLYSVSCNAEGEMKVDGKIRVVVDASIVGLGTLMDVEQEFYEGDGISHVVQKALENNGFSVRSTGSHNYGWYLSRISKPGMMGGKEPVIDDYIRDQLEEQGKYSGLYDVDSLGEGDFAQFSGWTFKQNGDLPSVGMASKYAEDGDVIVLEFVLHVDELE